MSIAVDLVRRIVREVLQPRVLLLAGQPLATAEKEELAP
jgi:hypothetical protein